MTRRATNHAADLKKRAKKPAFFKDSLHRVGVSLHGVWVRACHATNLGVLPECNAETSEIPERIEALVGAAAEQFGVSAFEDLHA